MMNGMAGFMFEMRVIPGALDAGRYSDARKKTKRRVLTVATIEEKLADNGNRRLLYLGIHMLIDLIAKIDELSHFLSLIPDLARLLDVKPLELRRTKLVPVPTMARDEAKTQNMKGVIDDLMAWAGLSPEQVEETVVVLAGDQLTIEQARGAHGYLELPHGSTVYETRGFGLPLVGWWHQKWYVPTKRFLPH